jgi:hypothetical protein
MPLQITNETYNSLPALYANAGKWVDAEISFRNCYRAGSGTTNKFSSTNDSLSVQSGEWYDYGFSDGDTITMYFKENGTAVSFTRTINYINGNVMFFTSALPSGYQYKDFPTSGTLTGMFIAVNKQPTSVDFRFNLSPSGSTSVDSIIDGELNRFIDNAISSLSVSGSVSMTQLGNKSGGIVKDVVITRNADTTFTNAVTAGSATEYNYTITFTYFQWGLFQSDNSSPVWYQAADCLNPVVRVASFPQVNTANGEMSDLNGATFANVGWFDENYNGYPSAYTLTSIDLTDTSGNSLSQIAYNQTTHVTAVLNTPNQVNGSSNYRLGVAFTPFEDALYKNLNDSFENNALINAPEVDFQHSASPDATLRTGAQNADGARFDLQNIQFSHSTSVLTVDFDIIPDANNEAFFDALSDGLRNLMVWVQVSDHTLDGTQQSDEVNVLIYNDDCYNAPRIGVQYPDVVDDLLYDHASKDVTSTASPNTTTEDNVLYVGTFKVDENQVVDGVRAGIMCKNAVTGESFMLEEVYFDFANVPFIGGIYEVNETINRNFLLPPTTDRNIVRLTRDTSLDGSGQYGMKLEYGFLNNWRYWLEQSNVNDDLFDSSKPFNGKNQNWQDLQQGNWEFFVSYFVRIEDVDDFNYTPFVIRPYEDDPNVATSITITNSNGDVITAFPNTGIATVRVRFTWNQNFTNEWVECTLEQFEGQRIGFISSVLEHDGQSPNVIIPNVGETKLTPSVITSPFNACTVFFRVLCDQLPSGNISMTARVYSDPKTSFGYIITVAKDAEFAYSLRKVASDTIYPDSSPCIRVRRDSDDAEQDIGFVPNVDGALVLDETALTTFIGANNGFVTKIYDQSGNGNHLVQTTNANQPVIVLAGVIQTDPNNNKVAIDFDGTNDFMELSFDTTLLTELYTYGVFNRASTSINSVLLGDTDATPYSLYWTNTDNVTSAVGSGAVHSIGNTSTGDFLFSIARDSSDNVSANLNGVALTTVADANLSEAVTTVGATDSVRHNGFFQEVVLWNKDKSTQRTVIEDSVNDFYKIY